MATLYKSPRHKKYYNKRALVFMTDYQKQDNYKKRKSIDYQTMRFIQYGSELTLFTTSFALAEAVKEFNSQYENDALHNKHGLLIALVKHYSISTGKTHIIPREVYEYYPDIHALFGQWTNGYRPFNTLFKDLNDMQFLKASGHGYITTTRIKVFTTLFDKHCKILFEKSAKP